MFGVVKPPYIQFFLSIQISKFGFILGAFFYLPRSIRSLNSLHGSNISKFNSLKPGSLERTQQSDSQLDRCQSRLFRSQGLRKPRSLDRKVSSFEFGTWSKFKSCCDCWHLKKHLSLENNFWNLLETSQQNGFRDRKHPPNQSRLQHQQGSPQPAKLTTLCLHLTYSTHTSSITIHLRDCKSPLTINLWQHEVSSVSYKLFATIYPKGLCYTNKPQVLVRYYPKLHHLTPPQRQACVLMSQQRDSEKPKWPLPFFLGSVFSSAEHRFFGQLSRSNRWFQRQKHGATMGAEQFLHGRWRAIEVIARPGGCATSARHVETCWNMLKLHLSWLPLYLDVLVHVPRKSSEDDSRVVTNVPFFSSALALSRCFPWRSSEAAVTSANFDRNVTSNGPVPPSVFPEVHKDLGVVSHRMLSIPKVSNGKKGKAGDGNLKCESPHTIYIYI